MVESRENGEKVIEGRGDLTIKKKADAEMSNGQEVELVVTTNSPFTLCIGHCSQWFICVKCSNPPIRKMRHMERYDKVLQVI